MRVRMKEKHLTVILERVSSGCKSSLTKYREFYDGVHLGHTVHQ